MYIDRFVAMDTNKVNRLAVWERTYSVTFWFKSVDVDIVCSWSVCFYAQTINIVGLATGVDRYVDHPDLTPTDFFLYGGKWNMLFMRTPLDTKEELISRVTAAAMVTY